VIIRLICAVVINYEPSYLQEMGYGHICAKVVLSVALNSTDIRVIADEDGEYVTLRAPEGTEDVELPSVYKLYSPPDEPYCIRYGTDSGNEYYIALGVTHVGGGIWDDGGSITADEMLRDSAHFEQHLRGRFEELKKLLHLPGDLEPKFGTYISFGQVQY